MVQGGGAACLDDEGLAEINTLIDYYLENAKILKEGAEEIGLKVRTIKLIKIACNVASIRGQG